MSFIRPDIFYLLWALPLAVLVLVYGARRRTRILAAFAKPQALANLAAEASPTRRLVKAVLLVLALASLIPALAGPLLGYAWQPVERKGVDLMVVLDISKSMLARDLPPNRLERAKREVLDLLDRLQGERVGLTAFAGTAFVHCPMTLDQSAFRLFLDAIGPDYAPVGGTNLAQALDVAIKALDQPNGGDRVILLITDGEPTSDPDREAALEAATRAAEADITIYCLGMGTPEGAPVAAPDGGFIKDTYGAIVHSKLSEGTLRDIARRGKGVYVRSTAGDEDLQTIYEGHMLRDTSSELLSEGKKRIPMDRYRWFAGLALVLLLAEALISDRRRIVGLVLVCLLTALTPGFAQAGVHSDLKKGLEAYDQELYLDAWNNWLKAQIEAPEHPDVLFDLGAAAYRLKRFPEAQQQYEAAAEGYAEAGKTLYQAKALYNAGNAQYRQSNLPGAVKSYEQALKLNPDDADAKANLEYVKELIRQQPPQQQPKSGTNQQDKSPDKQGQQHMDKNEQDQQNEQQGEKGKGQGEQDSQDGEQGQDQQPEGAQDQGQQNRQQQINADGSMGRDRSEDQNPGSAVEQQGGMSQEEMQAAKALLNRLEDKPGKGSVPPVYKEHWIEKDW